MEKQVNIQPAIIVHGGAGPWPIPSQRLDIARKACRDAAAVAQQLLLAGGSALAAVETAVNLLEDCPVLDAGVGSYLNAAGEIEMDALIMDGATLEIGAVAAVQRIRYPISLARRLLDEPKANFLVGIGAEAWADGLGFPRCTTAELIPPPLAESSAGPLGDTVGAVAIDLDGNLATATSTGGMKGKIPGRVGDSPLVGSGGFADNRSAAVGATGQGEALMKIVISKQVADYVSGGLTAQAACDAAIALLIERTGGEGGVIAVDRHGRLGYARNTAAMPVAWAIGGAEIVIDA